MSREHAIYNQTAIKPTESKSSNLAAPWSPTEWTKPQTGVIFEGKLLGRYRRSVVDSKNQRIRFAILTIEYTSAFKREFDKEGKEVPIHQGKTKKVSTGFLPSSYKDLEVEESGKLTAEEVRQMIGGTPITQLGEKTSGNVFEFWGEEEVMEKVEFFRDEPVRLKTRGNSPLIETITKLNEKNTSISNFAGDTAGDSWTQKLMTKKEPAKPLPQDKLQGADDSEWD